MDKPKAPTQQEDFRKRFEEPGEPIGTNADGQVEVYPLSELNARIAERDVDEQALGDAMEEPDPDEDLDDVSDLDDEVEEDDHL